jgi:uncharacterized protein (TIGR00304 family)
MGEGFIEAMRSATVRGLGIALLIVGLVTLIWSVNEGLIQFYLIVIVPVFASDNVIGLLPLLAIFAGIALLMFSPVFDRDYLDAIETGDSERREVGSDSDRSKVGGVVLIGPIPILFGSDKKTALIAAALAIIVMAIIILLLLL